MSLVQKNNLFDQVNLGNDLQKASQSINETVSGLSKQSVSSLTSISDSVKSGVAIVSEEQTRLRDNLSTYVSSAIKGINEGLKSITGGMLNLNDLGRVVTYQDGFKVSTDELLSIAAGGLGFNINSMRDLKQQIGDGFLDQLDMMTGGLARGLFYADGTSFGINDNWQLNLGQDIIDFITRTGYDDFGEVINLAALNSVLNTMLYETVKFGMYDGYGAYESQYTFRDDYINALINSIQYCIGNGDIKSLETILKIIEEEGVNKVRAQYPELIQDMLSAFTFSDGTTYDDYPELRRLLLSCFETIGGKDWYKYPTQLGMATNLALVNYISDDAKLLLEEEPELIPLLCCSGIFMEESALLTFTNDFPDAIILS